jgi:hypothetical protein
MFNRQLVAEIGYGTLDLFHGQPVTVSGIGHAVRPLDGDARTGLEPDEDVVLRLRDRWWFVAADDFRDAFDRACTDGRRGRSIDLANPADIRAVVLPADAAERDAVLERLTAQRTTSA